jgi:transcriptional regulator with XRE-family HTH domain
MNSSTTFVFGDWLRTLRKQMGLTRQAVADRAGGSISQQYIHAIETGKSTNIGSEKLEALARGLGIPPSVLHQALLERTPPMLRLIVPGRESEASDEQEAMTIPYFLNDPSLFAVEVTNDDMAPRMERGDIAIVQPVRNDVPQEPGWIYLLESKYQQPMFRYLMDRPAGSGNYWLVAHDSDRIPATQLGAEGYHLSGRVVEVRKGKSLFRPTE